MKKYGVYLMGVLYVLAGLNHFWHPEIYERMIGGMLPYGLELVYASGIAEMVLGIGVMIPATRTIAAWGLITMLVAIFPANVNMALHPADWHMNPWGLYLRLPLQLLFIYWAYLFTKPQN